MLKAGNFRSAEKKTTLSTLKGNNWTEKLNRSFDERRFRYSAICTAQKMKFLIKDFFNKYDQIRRKLWDLVTFNEEILNENFIFCAVM